MLIPAVLLLVAGAGWRKMVKGLLLSLLVAFVGAMLVGVATFKIGYAMDRSGEWRGFGALIIGALAGIAIFFILLIASVWWLVRTRRMTRERAPVLPVLFGVGGAGTILAVVSIAYAVIGVQVSGKRQVSRVRFTGPLSSVILPTGDSARRSADAVRPKAVRVAEADPAGGSVSG